MLSSLKALYRRWNQKKIARQLFITLYRRYKHQKLALGMRDPMVETTLEALTHCANSSLAGRDDFCGCQSAQKLLQHSLKRSSRELIHELATTLALAAFILIFVRQMVFEHQVIPTGSMRPTFREMDHVIVSKTAYGLNSPLGIGHLAFDPQLLQRGQIATLTAENLPFIGQDTLHFGLIKGKKRFVKRLVATMGDRVWFYGGHVFVLAPGADHLLSSETYIGPCHDYVPFHQFFGSLESQGSKIESLHFRKPVRTLEKGAWNRWSGNLSQEEAFLPWGMQHYAMARLLKSQELHYSSASSIGLEKADYYLEISHGPTIYPTALSSRDSASPFYVYRTLLALSQEHVANLQRSLYTSRFVVKGEKASLYSGESSNLALAQVALPGVSDGLYELQKGQAYQVKSDGERTLLSQEHPLYQTSLLCTLFNCGVHWSPKLAAQATSAPWLPYRYVYYDRGDLKCMGGLLMKQADPDLVSFVDRQMALQSQTSFYPAFIDPGLPSVELVKEKGLQVGEREVLLLGDNHSNSADGRDFGLVPLENIQGSPSYRIWPPSSLLEGIDAPRRAFNRYDAMIAAFFLAIWLAWRGYEYRRYNQALDEFKQS